MIGLIVKVENVYSDGHQSETTETVELADVASIDELWDQLYEITGDGHDIGGQLGYCHTVTVLGCAERPEFVGQINEWVGA